MAEDNGYDLVKLRGAGDTAAGTNGDGGELEQLDAVRFEQLVLQVWLGGDTVFSKQMILGSDGSDLEMFQIESRTYLKGFARLTVAAAAAAEAMDADEESAKRSQKVHQVT